MVHLIGVQLSNLSRLVEAHPVWLPVENRFQTPRGLIVPADLIVACRD